MCLEEQRESISPPRSSLFQHSLDLLIWAADILSTTEESHTRLWIFFYIQENPPVSLLAPLSMWKCSWFKWYHATPMLVSRATVSLVGYFLPPRFLWQLAAATSCFSFQLKWPLLVWYTEDFAVRRRTWQRGCARVLKLKLQLLRFSSGVLETASPSVTAGTNQCLTGRLTGSGFPLSLPGGEKRPPDLCTLAQTSFSTSAAANQPSGPQQPQISLESLSGRWNLLQGGSFLNKVQ